MCHKSAIRYSSTSGEPQLGRSAEKTHHWSNCGIIAGWCWGFLWLEGESGQREAQEKGRDRSRNCHQIQCPLWNHRTLFSSVPIKYWLQIWGDPSGLPFLHRVTNVLLPKGDSGCCPRECSGGHWSATASPGWAAHHEVHWVIVGLQLSFRLCYLTGWKETCCPETLWRNVRCSASVIFKKSQIQARWIVLWN